MNVSLGKRIKKRLRKVWYSHIFSCIRISPGNCSSATENVSVTAKATSTENLQILLVKTLKNQAEDRKYHAQLGKTLVYLTNLLEQFSNSYSAQHIPAEKLSKFTITVAQNRLIQRKQNPNTNSLLSLHDKPLFPCPNAKIFPKGDFGSALIYNLPKDKAVQSTLATPSVTASKLIQTQLMSFSRFDVMGFKVDLIEHMRTLKQDVVTLRQLLFKVEDWYGWGCREAYWKYDELGGNKFLEAKVRATNFVKFYKLRKIDDGKQKRHGRRRRNV